MARRRKVEDNKGKPKWFPLSEATREELTRSWGTLERRSAEQESAEAQRALLRAWRGTQGKAVGKKEWNEEKILKRLLWPDDSAGILGRRAIWSESRAGWPDDRAGWPSDRAGWPDDRSGSEKGPFRTWPRDRHSGRYIAMGYLPDVPDARDFGVRGKRYQERLTKLCAMANEQESKPRQSFLLDAADTDLNPSAFSLLPGGHFSPVEDQGPIGSCTAQATVGALEYLMAASGNGRMDLSPLFLYKVTRRVAGLFGDSGAYIREAIKAARIFGIPPESEWPYKPEWLEREPEAFLYSYAANFKAIEYARLDCSGADVPAEKVLTDVKRSILDGFPVIFGFPVHESISDISAPDFVVPPPQSEDDRRLGGHAVLAIGFDDDLPVPSSSLPDFTEEDKKGALIFRNSWGADWGDGGYACLPYYYVRNSLAVDFWTILQTEWLDLEVFK